MNIFVLDHSIQNCAKYHVDKHVVKMILEYCQLLSTAHRVIDGKEVVTLSESGRRSKGYILSDYRQDVLYKATHINHPSAVWVRQSAFHYTWLSNLLTELCLEYTYRYNKVHKCASSGLVSELKLLPSNIRFDTGFVLPPPAMPEYCKVAGDVVQSYRNYYMKEKVGIASWSGKFNSRSVPPWFVL